MNRHRTGSRDGRGGHGGGVLSFLKKIRLAMIGKIIYHYKIIEKLGKVSIGIVFRAEDTKLKRSVALKFLPLYLTTDKEAIE
jgi:serine/threonine protein kinase